MLVARQPKLLQFVAVRNFQRPGVFGQQIVAIRNDGLQRFKVDRALGLGNLRLGRDAQDLCEPQRL